MKLHELAALASNKENFTELNHYIEFCHEWLDFVGTQGNLQAEIVSRNETQYRFLQFKEEGSFNVTRPLNYNLMYCRRDIVQATHRLIQILSSVRESNSIQNREIINRSIYTIQQCIGSALDSLPVGKSNTARKVNGDLFERFIRIILASAGIDCTSGIVNVPVDVDCKETFMMSYQHDLIIKSGEYVKIIGSVKTSSKDRLDKIFVDKFLLAKLTGKDVPYVAVFLNDVQRKGKTPNCYGVNSTFLPGHFKGYTIKLNPLDGVYYFDIRHNMLTDHILKEHIRTFDYFLFDDIWPLLNREKVKVNI